MLLGDGKNKVGVGHHGVLKNSKLKQTPARTAILALFESNQAALTIGMIHDLLRIKMGSKVPDWATVYRNVVQLSASKIIDSFDIGDGALRYEMARHHHDSSHHHHHLICNVCGRIDHLEVCQDQVIQKLALKSGYTNLKHKLEFFGTCPKCVK